LSCGEALDENVKVIFWKLILALIAEKTWQECYEVVNMIQDSFYKRVDYHLQTKDVVFYLLWE